MKLTYLYFKTFGNLRNQEINLDSEFRFSVEVARRRLSVAKGKSLPRDFFSVSGLQSGPVESVSAIVGENGSGKTSIARFLQELLSGTKKQTDFIIVFVLDGRYYLISNFQREDIDLSAVDDLIPSENRISWDEISDGLNESWKSRLARLKLAYFSPHFTAEPIFKADWSQTCDYSTIGLMHRDCTQRRRVFAPRMNIPRYAMSERLRILRVFEAYLEFEDAPEEPMEIFSKSGVTIEFDSMMPLSVLRNFQRNNRDRESQIGGFVRAILECPYFRGENSDWFFRVFVAFAVSFVKDQDLDFDDAHIKCGTEIIRSLFSLFNAIHSRGIAMSRFEIRDRVYEWIDWGERNLVSGQRAADAFANMDSRRLSGLKRMLKGLEELERRQRFQRDSRSVRIEFGGEIEEVRLALEVAGGYADCVGALSFLDFKIYPRLSSGEMAFLSMWGRLYDFMLVCGRQGDALIFMDESETALHPAWQRRLVWYVIWFMEHFAPKMKVHLVFASHSPILLSDIPKGNVHFAKSPYDPKGVQKRELDRLQDTFAANVFDLYRLPFFLRAGTVGQFASEKVNSLLKIPAGQKRLDLGDSVRLSYEDLRALVGLIGDPFVRRYLQGKFGMEEGLQP